MFREIGVIFIQIFCDISHIYIVLLLSLSLLFLSFCCLYPKRRERKDCFKCCLNNGCTDIIPLMFYNQLNSSISSCISKYLIRNVIFFLLNSLWLNWHSLNVKKIKKFGVQPPTPIKIVFDRYQLTLSTYCSSYKQILNRLGGHYSKLEKTNPYTLHSNTFHLLLHRLHHKLRFFVYTLQATAIWV